MADPVRKEATRGAEANGTVPTAREEAGSALPATEERRGALRVLVTLGGLAYAGALAVPAAAFVAGPGEAGSGTARWIRVGRLADLPPGAPQRLQVVGDERDAFTVSRDERLGSVWVTREGDGARALSATCPHLGCAVDLRADKQGFGCPCHTSQFGLGGEVKSGPSPRGMDPLAARVVDGWVEVDFRRFRQGVADRREVGS
jgi:quinol---cytochrome c reductase iron-sulfur subunit, bacillus type